ncbi:kinesin-like protein NACK2 [Pyrus ussuriensis x Pyrus communis]|uniref:Kinesin-like protein NACK2 n=1 Tax=Pyrus ussuriensis x Pyrus communis TaxID=2448454 RepID=A0A5N5I2F2_9ROSA|nr:kinesin-like protein NACK2 [Pyrus ussuriensis x Pyrus communis]
MLTADEREMLYAKWMILSGGKQSRLQLVNKLWTDPHNMQNVQESAEVVAKLKTWMGWNLISNLLNL